MSTPEGRVKRKVDNALHTAGAWFFSPQSGPYGRSGVPDRIVCANGVFVGIEVKSDKTKKPTRLQINCMEKIESSGGKCFVVYDGATLDVAMEFIRTCIGDKHASTKQTEDTTDETE